nr:hypothetical protein [Mycobacterium sp.]
SGWGGGLPGFGGGLASPGFSDLGAPGFGGSPEGIRERVGALRRERDSDPPDIPADATSDPMPDEPAPEEPAPADPASDDPATVHLPSGETVSAPSAEVAAAMTAALAGTPIPEAFRQQGITIQAPGAAVTAPVALTDVLPGDVGVLADRHALALGNGTALLDNQIQPIGSVIGPGFLGWQHPPAPEATTQTPTTQTPEVPAPTRPAETAPS